MKNLYEILADFSQAKNEAERKAVLVKYASPAFLTFLRLALDKRIKFLIKEKPKYKPLDAAAGMGYSNYGIELRRMYLFIEGHPHRPAALTDKRMNELCLQILEGLEPKEAEVFSDLVTNNFKVPNLTPKLVAKTFPQLFADLG